LASSPHAVLRPGRAPCIDPAAAQVSLLGGFAAHCGCGPLELPLVAQRLVAFLALQSRPVTRSFVAGQLWLTSSQERAHASLRTTLWRARVDGHELVSGTSTHLALTDGVRVDLHDARARADRLLRGAAAAEDGDLECLADAGDLLPDWYDDWLVIERERFRQLRLLALETLCERFSRAGRHAAAADAGLAAVAGEPLRESAHRVLMRSYLADGNCVEARRQYRIFAGLLDRHLGLDPSPEMLALVAGIPDPVTFG
jgi:DNA-binding SARP family transcriptional activator